MWETLHEVTNSFPSIEDFGLTSQIRRAACSVPANIAEGYGKGTKPAFALHVRHARGSVYELCTLVEGAARFQYIDGARAAQILDELDQISKMIDGFLRSLAHVEVKEDIVLYDADQPYSQLLPLSYQLPT